jgi:hypothetical protein
MSEQRCESEPQLTLLQEAVLSSLCERYHVAYAPRHYAPSFDLPPGYVCGWVGGFDIQRDHPTIYVGCSPEGRISS